MRGNGNKSARRRSKAGIPRTSQTSTGTRVGNSTLAGGESLFIGATGFARVAAGDWLQHHLFLTEFPDTFLVGGVVEDPVLIASLNRLAASPDTSDQSWNPLSYRMEAFATTSVMLDDGSWNIFHTFLRSYGPDVDETIYAKNADDWALFERFEQFLAPNS